MVVSLRQPAGPVPAENRIDISCLHSKIVAVEVGRRLTLLQTVPLSKAASLCTQIMVTTILRTCLTVAWQRPTIAHVEGIMRLTVTLYSTLGTNFDYFLDRNLMKVEAHGRLAVEIAFVL